MGRWVGAWVGGWVSGRVDMGGWVRVWLCACGVRAFRAARRVRVVGTRACVDLFASAGSRGSSLPCGCLRLRVGPPTQDPKRATRASEPFVGDRRLGDHSTRARLVGGVVSGGDNRRVGGAMSVVVRGACTSHNPTSKTPCYLRGAGRRAQYALGSAQQGSATCHAARLRHAAAEACSASRTRSLTAGSGHKMALFSSAAFPTLREHVHVHTYPVLDRPPYRLKEAPVAADI